MHTVRACCRICSNSNNSTTHSNNDNTISNHSSNSTLLNHLVCLETGSFREQQSEECLPAVVLVVTQMTPLARLRELIHDCWTTVVGATIPRVRGGHPGGEPDDDDDDDDDRGRRYGSPRGRSRQRSDGVRGSLVKVIPGVKEADKINLREQPNTTSLKSWLVLTRQEVVSAIGKSAREVIPWLTLSENPKTPMKKLEDPSRFPTLDAKLASALPRVAQGQVQFALQLFCEECHKSGRFPTGRQLQIFIKEFSIDSEQAALYDLHDVLAVKWQGDSGIQQFLNQWAQAVNRMRTSPRPILWGHMKKSVVLKHDMLLFEPMSKDDSNKIYYHLLAVLRRQAQKDRFDKNREVQTRTGVASVLGMPAETQNRSKSPANGECFYFL
eukprot:6480787-Amphidinium_carterae.1